MGTGSFIIYGLIDPRNGQLRYVGKTERTLRQRLYSHLSKSRSEAPKTYVNKWIRSILLAGLEPEVEVLEVCSDSAELNEAEQWHIAYWRSLGCELTNLTAGGEGTSGWSPSAEWRRRRSEFMQGKRYSLGVRPNEETRQKLSESHRGKTTGPHPEERKLKNSRSQGGRPVVDSNGARYETAAEAARTLGLKQSAVSAVLLGKRKKHHGYTFKFIEA
jgi:group I intron endonuclease